MEKRFVLAGSLGGLLVFLGQSVCAQRIIRWTDYLYPVRFEHLSVEQGLSQSSVLCILQDKKGFLWFGTEDGLNRYDGYNFTVFRNDPADPFSLGGNKILTLFEDRQGTLWVGTGGGGLNRYDRERSRFVRYTYDPIAHWQSDNRPGLSDNDVKCIFEDGQGILWLGTDGSGLCQVVRRGGEVVSFVSYETAPGRLGAPSTNYISALHEDKGGTLWVGTEDGGLVKLRNRELVEFAHYLPDPKQPANSPANKITAIQEDGYGDLWVGTQRGLCRFARGSDRLTRYLHAPDNPRSLSDNYVRRLYRDRAGVLWVGTDGGGLNKIVPGPARGSPPDFVRYRHDARNPQGLNDNGVESIFEDRSGVLWVGTYNGGLNKLVMRGNQGSERERRGFVHYSANPLDPGSLSHDSVNAVLEDSRGILWIGTDGGGLNEVRPPVREDVPLEFIRRQPGAASAAGLSDRVVTSLCEDSRGDLWIGTYTGGLNRLGRTTTGSPEQRFVHYRHEPSDEGSLSSDFVMAIHEDRLRTLWVGTIDGGLNRFDRNRDRFVRYTADDEVPGRLSDNSVFAVYEDWEARLWVGTAEGLNLLDRKTNLFTHYKNVPTDPESISSNLIRAIYQDRSGTLWIGTDGGGLNQLVAAGVGKRRPKFKAYRMRDGLPNDSVLGILEDDRGNLWLSTHRGLSRFDPSRGTFRNYDSNDGLQGNDFRGAACWKSRSGELFFGGSHGFNVFHPEQIQDNPNAPPIVILDFQLFNKSVPVQKKQEDGRVILRESISETDQIALSFRDAVFSFQFAALHYVAPHENEYAYMMEGLDRDWNFIGNRRFVTYTTLPPGDYVFRVKGANGDGVWNERGVSLRIAITPPFWKTIWFYAASLGAVLSLGITLYRLRLSQVRRREIELEGQVEERTQQLAEVNQQLNQANARLRRLATRDELTGIGNMRLFRAFYSREWRRVVRSGLPMSLIMIDVDFFKLYNDTYGHSAGDECLKKVARCIRSYANRPGDLAARYGGEEFIVVLAGMDAQDTAQLAERMRRDVESMAIPHEHSSIASRLTISLGCATLIPSREDNPDLLFKEVDTALYLSKQNGRNRTTVWPDSGGAGRRGARHKVD